MNRMRRRTLIAMVASLIPTLALREMASAQIGTEAVNQGDGFLPRSQGGAIECGIGPVTIQNGAPGSGHEHHVRASAPWSCGKAAHDNDTRILRVYAAVDNGDGTFRKFVSEEKTVPGDNANSGTLTTAWNTSCGAGSGDFAGAVSKKIQGGNLFQEAGPTVVLNSDAPSCL